MTDIHTQLRPQLSRRPRVACEFTADILVVDDDPTVLRMTDRLLRAAGYRTINALGSTAAGDVLHTTRFSLLLLDVHMPLRDGIALAKGIREGEFAWANRNARIVFLTSDDGETTYEATYDVSAAGFLLKPATGRLIEVVDSFLRRAA